MKSIKNIEFNPEAVKKMSFDKFDKVINGYVENKKIQKPSAKEVEYIYEKITGNKVKKAEKPEGNNIKNNEK
jgi:hypothetical protein